MDNSSLEKLVPQTVILATTSTGQSTVRKTLQLTIVCSHDSGSGKSHTVVLFTQAFVNSSTTHTDTKRLATPTGQSYNKILCTSSPTHLTQKFQIYQKDEQVKLCYYDRNNASLYFLNRQAAPIL